MPRNPNNSHPPQDAGSILDHLDKLESVKGGKYICPVCGGNNLTVATKGKDTGAATCWSGGCSWKSIMDVIAPLPPRNSSGANGTRPRRKPNAFKTKTQKDKDAIETEIKIDGKVTELIYQIESEATTPAAALVSLTAWCKEHGYNSYTASQLLKEQINALKAATGYDDDEMAPVLLRDYRKISAEFGDRLRYNTLFNQVELDGERLDPATAKIELIVTHKMKLKSGRDDIGDCVMKIAKEHQYNPVEEYLEDCYRHYGHQTDILQDFALQTLGATEPIHNILVCKFLVSAVARIFEPGCKVDTALILQGAQGFGKSSFFQILASSEWFDDSFGNSSDKDERLKLHSAWILEWAELETVFRRKDVSAVKAFITTKIDRIRPPYGRSIEFLPRRSVFCGTTNELEFLADPTGNRRFWIVPMGKKLDFAALEKSRDRIWAAAVSLYRAGYRWELSQEEETEAKAIAQQYEATDTWHDEIADWLEFRETCSVQEILTDVLRIELHSQSKKEQLRVRAILIRQNWQQASNPTLYKGKRVRIWNRPDTFSPDFTVSVCQNAENPHE
ncbi:MAG: hypothetical protein B0A82_26880 [Alkalinema sp. CACIAM 70d]|nr:MAG: hypothetical protein B0A82_26880 [Alkalinema sp. CACIAM 70d]